MPPTLLCDACSAAYADTVPRWRCDCGAPLNLEQKPFEVDKLEPLLPSLWRYRHALSLSDVADPVSFGEGGTRLLAWRIDKRPVMLKLEYVSPTGSFKDRGATTAVTQALSWRVPRLIEDSSGNAGAAMAAYCAYANLPCTIFAPEDAPAAKLHHIASLGAELVLVAGTRQDVANAALASADSGYYAGHGWNPFFLEGTKTFAFELAEQLGALTPAAVFFPVGNATLLLGAWLGFRQLREAKLIPRLPKVFAVQAAHCAPLAAARAGRTEALAPRDTLADGLKVQQPPRLKQILQAVEESGGEVITVPEDEILLDWRLLCNNGFFVEPTSAVVVSAFRRTEALPQEDGPVVLALTGSGMRTRPEVLAGEL